jgi:hypothetical protein
MIFTWLLESDGNYKYIIDHVSSDYSPLVDLILREFSDSVCRRLVQLSKSDRKSVQYRQPTEQDRNKVRVVMNYLVSSLIR